MAQCFLSPILRSLPKSSAGSRSILELWRASTGSLLANAAYGALKAGASELLADGTSTYGKSGITQADLRAAFR